MSKPILCQEISRGQTPEDDVISLTYDARFLRRKVVHSTGGLAILIDLEHTTSLQHGDALVLEDGRHVEVIAASEELLKISGDLVRLAWHIGNRHTPCQVRSDHLLIQRDHVLRDMLERLGADISEISAPFTPEGGAYGMGRTHGHSHDH